MSTNVKLSDDLVDDARRHGAIGHRSVPKQIEHWSRMGKVAEENSDLPLAMIKDILCAQVEEAHKIYVFD